MQLNVKLTCGNKNSLEHTHTQKLKLLIYNVLLIMMVLLIQIFDVP